MLDSAYLANEITNLETQLAQARQTVSQIEGAVYAIRSIKNKLEQEVAEAEKKAKEAEAKIEEVNPSSNEEQPVEDALNGA